MTETVSRLFAANLFLWTAAIPDLKRKKIPVWIPMLFGAAALTADLFVPTCMDRSTLWAGAVPGTFFLLLTLVSKGRIGEGDGICLLVCGLFTGIAQALLITEGALVLAALTGGFCMATRRLRARDRIPFVPFLAVTASLLVLCGEIGNP